jgi:hypothetical protein
MNIDNANKYNDNCDAINCNLKYYVSNKICLMCNGIVSS